LLFVEFFRDDYFDGYEMVAFLVVVWGQLLHTVISYFLFLFVLHAWVNLHFHVAIESFHGQLSAQDGLRDCNEEVCLNVRPLPLEVGMGLHLDLDHKVSMWACRAEVTLLTYPQVHSIIHSLGDIDGFFN
jgi:hypothetical protein